MKKNIWLWIFLVSCIVPFSALLGLAGVPGIVSIAKALHYNAIGARIIQLVGFIALLIHYFILWKTFHHSYDKIVMLLVTGLIAGEGFAIFADLYPILQDFDYQVVRLIRVGLIFAVLYFFIFEPKRISRLG